MNATASRTDRRCSTCEASLFVKLTRREDGRLERSVYCASCDRGRDVTSNLARRAALVVAAAREVA
jgi:hypothetical protein